LADPGPNQPTEPIVPAGPSGSAGATEPIPATGGPPPAPPAAPPGTAGRFPTSVGSLVTLVAGILLVVAPFLPWLSLTVNVAGGKARGARVRGRGGLSTTGLHLPDGRIVLAIGFAVLVVALLAIAARSERLRLVSGVLVLALGVVATTLAVTILVARAEVPGLTQIAMVLSRSGGKVGAFLGRIEISKGAGLWVALIGGIVPVAAAVVEIMSAVRRPGFETPAAL
jgi:hypothetical protein